MAERRQAVRREPIETEIDDGRVFVAKPLPWMAAGDLGNEILRQNVESSNELIRMYTDPDSGLPQLEMKLKQKISDWQVPLLLAYPDNKKEDFTEPRILDIDESAALLLAAMEVNHLDHLNHLVDPNFNPPTLNGGIDSSTAEGEVLGQRIESMVGSSSQDSPAKLSSISPEENSSPS